jgi:anti-anti-sigma factor
MAPNELRLQVRKHEDVAIVDLQGEINAFAEGQLSSGYAEAERTEANTILLNFAGVEYINSTGIALIVSLLARARAAHRRLLACGLSEHYVEIFNITRLADFMTVFPDEQSALAIQSGPTAESTSEGSLTA